MSADRPASRVLLLHATAGSGHKRAAQALEIAFKSLEPDGHVRTHDTLTFGSRLFQRGYSPAYNTLVGRVPRVWGLLWKGLEHPRAHRAGERILLYSLTKGGEILLSRIAPQLQRAGSVFGEPLDDPYISRKPIVLRAAKDGGITVIAPAEGTRVVCGQTPVEGHLDVGPEQLARGVPLVLAGRVVLLLHLVEPDVGTITSSMGMAGDSAGMKNLSRAFSMPMTAAATATSVRNGNMIRVRVTVSSNLPGTCWYSEANRCVSG